MLLSTDFYKIDLGDYSLVRIARDVRSLVASSKSLSDLEKEITLLGKELPSKPYGKKELLDLLSNIYWEKKHPGKPKPLFEEPMLINSIKDEHPEKQEEIWNSNSWAIEQKRNGVRCLAYLGGKSYFTSRNISVTDFLPEGLTQQLAHLDPKDETLDGTVLDGEVISIKKDINTAPFVKSGKGTLTNNVLQACTALLSIERSVEAQAANGWPLRYIAYDILRYKGRNVKNLPYSERRNYLADSLLEWQSHLSRPESIILNASFTQDKRKFYEEAVARGEEGAVLKNVSGIYKGGQTRTRDQLKVKKEEEYDAVVIDVQPPKSGKFKKEGLIGGLVFGCKDQNTGVWYRIAAVSNLDLSFRKEWSIQDSSGNFLGVKDGLLGTVWEIQGHDWTKNIQLSHARILRPRISGPDSKSPDEAVFDLNAIIEKQMAQEGDGGSRPTPIPCKPPISSIDFSPETSVTEGTLPPERPQIVAETQKIWVHNGVSEKIKILRAGRSNSRVKLENGTIIKIPTSEIYDA